MPTIDPTDTAPPQDQPEQPATAAHFQNCGAPFQTSTWCPGCIDEARRAYGVRVTVDELRFLLGLAKYAPGALVCDDRDDNGNCGGDCGTHALLAQLEARCAT